MVVGGGGVGDMPLSHSQKLTTVLPTLLVQESMEGPLRTGLPIRGEREQASASRQ